MAAPMPRLPPGTSAIFPSSLMRASIYAPPPDATQRELRGSGDAGVLDGARVVGAGALNAGGVGRALAGVGGRRAHAQALVAGVGGAERRRPARLVGTVVAARLRADARRRAAGSVEAVGGGEAVIADPAGRARHAHRRLHRLLE